MHFVIVNTEILTLFHLVSLPSLAPSSNIFIRLILRKQDWRLYCHKIFRMLDIHKILQKKDSASKKSWLACMYTAESFLNFPYQWYKKTSSCTSHFTAVRSNVLFLLLSIYGHTQCIASPSPWLYVSQIFLAGPEIPAVFLAVSPSQDLELWRRLIWQPVQSPHFPGLSAGCQTSVNAGPISIRSMYQVGKHHKTAQGLQYIVPRGHLQ